MKNTPETNIKEWLRGLANRRKSAFGAEGLKGCRYDEAADTIEQLEAEVEHWKTEDANSVSLIQALGEEVEQLTAEIERLKK